MNLMNRCVFLFGSAYRSFRFLRWRTLQKLSVIRQSSFRSGLSCLAEAGCHPGEGPYSLQLLYPARSYKIIKHENPYIGILFFYQTQDEPISQTLSNHRIMRSVHPECGRPSGSAAGSFQTSKGAHIRARHDRV